MNPCRIQFSVIIGASATALMCLVLASGCTEPEAAAGGHAVISPGQPSHRSERQRVEQYAAAIRDVLRRDAECGEQFRTNAPADAVLAVKNCVRSMRQIDLRECPPEFREAYLRHTYAWAELIPLGQRYAGFEGEILALLEMLAGEYDADKQLAQIEKAISDTFFEVERIALGYGVQTEN